MPALQNTGARRKRLALLAATMGSFVAGHERDHRGPPT
jgi:hypothetical protein